MEPAVQPLILVIEDQPAIADLICEVLQEHGYRCVTANGADGALRLLDTIVPALITLDLGLPGVSGRTLLQLIHANAQTRDIPVIIVSAERVIEPQLRAACQAVLPKPFDVNHLVLMIQQVLGLEGGGTQARELGQ